MMKSLPILLLILIGYYGLSAQDSVITIKTGYKVGDVLTPSDMFYYPQFTNGKIFFRNGSRAEGNINYSRLFDQVLFINPKKGDTLALSDEETIKFIAVAQDTFYFDEGYVRLLSVNEGIKLAEKQIWVVADVRRIGTHNKSTSTVAITPLNSYTDAGVNRAKSYDFPVAEDLIIRKETHYYFGNTYNHFVRATKKKLLLLFPKYQSKIENYLKENKVNFDKREDLEKLAQFIGNL